MSITVAGSAFATDVKKTNNEAAESFNRQFKNASNISWTTGENFLKATFIVNNCEMEAFYNLHGGLIGTSEKITLEQVPVKVKRSFAKKFERYSVIEVIRFQGSEGSSFYLGAENDQEKLIVKVCPDQSLSIFKKVRK